MGQGNICGDYCDDKPVEAPPIQRRIRERQIHYTQPVVQYQSRIESGSKWPQPLVGENFRDFADRLCWCVVSSSRTKENNLDLMIRVIYDWVHMNIKYDKDSLIPTERKEQYDNDKTFITRLGVCVGKANLFKAMVNHACRYYDVKCKITVGFTNLRGSETAHEWNVICINNRNYHYDVTAGGRKFFKVPESQVKATSISELRKKTDYKTIFFSKRNKVL